MLLILAQSEQFEVNSNNQPLGTMQTHLYGQLHGTFQRDCVLGYFVIVGELLLESNRRLRLVSTCGRLAYCMLYFYLVSGLNFMHMANS